MRKAIPVTLFLSALLNLIGSPHTPAGRKIIFRNLAVSSDITVSSQGEKGLAGTFAVDGDTTTRWGSAFKDDEWMQLDLKRNYRIDRIVLKWEFAFAREYSLLGSSDGEKWTAVFNEKNGDGKTDVIDLPSLSFRFLKLQCIRRNTPYGFSLWELEVYSQDYPIAVADDFSDPGLTGWSGTVNYLPQQEDNTLRIERKPAVSGMFTGNVTMVLPEPITTSGFPCLSFLSKTSETLRLIIHLEYTDGMKTTLTSLLIPDNRWHFCSYALDTARSQPLNKMSLQMISAAPDKDSVTLYLDDLVIGDQGSIHKPDIKLLQKLCHKAEKYWRSAVREENSPQFHNNVLEKYRHEIQVAEEVLNNPGLAQVEIDNAVARLMLANADMESSVMLQPMPMKTCNPLATAETRYLYNNMKAMEGRHFFFGQMDPFYIRGTPVGRAFQSDLEDICGSLPAMGSWELKNISLGIIDTAISNEVEYYYSQNGLVSFCWHMMDPTGSGFYLKDLPDKNAGNELLPGGKYHAWFLGQLDRIAFFFRQLKGPEGESVPILFRPYHEMDGDWFWWGKPTVSPGTFAKLWQFTFHYLVKEKKLNQLLFVFSPCDRFKTRDGVTGYLDYYPGDDFVDILAQDNYWQVRKGADSAAFVNQLKIMTQLAAEKNKISGLSETGLEGLGIPDWFTSVLLKPIKSDPLAGKITYISIWNRTFVPYPGHVTAPDFLKFYNDPVTFFIGDYPDLYHAPVKKETLR